MLLLHNMGLDFKILKSQTTAGICLVGSFIQLQIGNMKWWKAAEPSSDELYLEIIKAQVKGENTVGTV